MFHHAFRRFGRALVAAAATAAILCPLPASAQGDLLVAPTRVIMDGRRGAEVILSNIGSEEATYRIGLELRRMTDDGDLVPVTEDQANAKEQAAMAMVRYAPRRITLPPGQPQSVRIAARPAADLPDGEYRVHMTFTGIPKPRPVTQEAGNEQGISVKLIPVYGISIPVFVRKGRLESAVVLHDPKLATDAAGRPQFELQMTRSGQSSTYGELRVLHAGSDKPIYMARGIAIYPEVTDRKVTFTLSPDQAAEMKGKLRIEYREMPEAGGGLIAALDTVLN